jgi:hypothetical protein
MSSCAATTASGRPCRRPAGDDGLCVQHLRAGLPGPPGGLSEHAADLWWSVLERWKLEPAELALLREVVRVQTRCDVLAGVVEAEGPVAIGSRGQQVVSPAMVEARQQELVLGRLIAALRLPEDDDATVRPQRRGGFRVAQKIPPLRVVKQ